MAQLAVIESTVQKTHEWLGDIKRRLGFDNDHAAFAALRAVLHAVRDHLPTDDAAHLGAELPMLLRGLYYEGWNPSFGPANTERHHCLDGIRHALRDHAELQNTEQVTRIVLGVLDLHVAPGERTKIANILPRELRSLWPTESATA